MTVFTVGHGNRTVSELLAVLRPDASAVIDVRRFPRSRRNPQTNREALAVELPENDVSYRWWGDTLGGRRAPSPNSRHIAWRVDAFRGYADYLDTAPAREAIAALAACDGAAVMCAETVWWRCHRRLIADALTVRGVEVVHLLGEGQRNPHVLHPQLRIDGGGWPVYDAGVDQTLF